MSSDSSEQLEPQEEPETSLPDPPDDAHVDDDVCVAVSSARSGKPRRRRDRSWMAAVAVSLGCHMALAAGWWQWGPNVQWPDFSIRAGVGGTVGTGTIDSEESAAAPAKTVLPKTDVADAAPPSDGLGMLEDEPDAPSLARPTDSALSDAMDRGTDLIAVGHPGWSPDAVPTRGRLATHAASQDAPVGDSTRIAPLQSATGGGGDGLAIAGLSSLARNDPPRYPERARLERQEGTVVLQMLISADGHVRDVKVQRSSGYAMLDEAAVTKFATYVVDPYRENGVAMEMQLTDVPVIFRLHNRK